MRTLITGAAGFLGQGLVGAFEQGETCVLRLMDVRPFASRHEVVVGSVADLACVRAAMRGVDAMVLAHMAPRSPDAYAEPPVCFDINVKGTANLFFAAQEGLRFLTGNQRFFGRMFLLGFRRMFGGRDID